MSYQNPKTQHRVYVENVDRVQYNSVFLTYEGDSLSELKALFNARLPTPPKVTFDFYTKRFGMSNRTLCPETIPADVEEIHARCRIVHPQ